MLNKKTSIKKKRINTKYTRKPSNKKKKTNRSIFKILIYIILFFVIFCFVMALILYNKYIKDLPSISELENYNLAESSIIYDRNWKILNNVFKEKRTYVPYSKISKNMVNAIVAWEDKKFWTNPWVDIVWIFRAWFISITKWKKVWWTSTLTQQLIRNTIIENRRSDETLWESIERKLKELYLSYSLTKNGIPKEKILELYLNKIEFWHNSFGIEEASKTFFGKKASELNILESSIIASIPKWPTYYSPYNHRDRVVWSAIIYDKVEKNNENEKNKTAILTKKQMDDNPKMIGLLKETFKNLNWKTVKWNNIVTICWIKKENFGANFKIDNDWCAFLTYSELNVFLGSIKVEFWEKVIGYDIWRKDYILRRMLEDWYIDFKQFKNAIIDSITLNFKKNKENLKAPHFVFFIREYLEEKYWKDALYKWGLKIYTTLDYDAQQKAEEIIKKQVEKNTKNFNAKNAGLISIDNTNWDILAMVWSVDYSNEDIKWNVNVITSKLQPWSSFKPFVYAVWMYENEIWTKTPIYDLKTKFPWWYSPNNYDWKFMGKTNVSKALNHSRNIPAVKMYFLAWWTESIVKFMKKLGVESLDEKWDYWASLWLWSWEMTPLELAKAYSVFANMWEKIEINPILKIVDSKWNIIEEKKKELKKEKVISSWQTFLINHILSDTSTRPSPWNKYLSLKNRKVAAKTWTSTKPIKNKYWERVEFPANLWTVWYTPQITTIAWAWNSDWETLNYSWNGLEWAWPIWKEFMEYIHEDKKALKWVKPDDVKNINISEVTWYLPNPENNISKHLISSYFLNIPKKIDNSYQIVEYDALCNWIVTDETPKAAIRKATILEFHSLKPELPSWENPVLAWSKSKDAIERYWNTNWLLSSISDEKCVRESSSTNIVIKTNIDENLIYSPWNNYIEIAYESDAAIKKVEILINSLVEKSFDTEWKKRWAIVENLFIPAKYNNQKVTLEIRALDENYYSNSEVKSITIMEDKNAPIVELINPIDWTIKIYDDEFFNLKANIKDASPLKNVDIYIDNKIIKSYKDKRHINLAINKNKKLDLWKYIIKIETSDKNWNKTEKFVELKVLKR